MKKLYPYLISFFTLATIIVNGLATGLPLAGRTTKEISDMYPTLFTPAAITFSIWGVIYIALVVFSIYSFKKEVSRNVTIAYIISACLNMLWIVLWHNLRIASSVVIMLGLLGSLIYIYRNIRNEVSYFKVPISIYLGWISVATIANIAVFLFSKNWNGFGIGADVWTIIVMFVATLLALYYLFKENNLSFAGVIAWALFGINSQLSFVQMSLSTVPSPKYDMLSNLLIFARIFLLIIVVKIVYNLFIKYFKKNG